MRRVTLVAGALALTCCTSMLDDLEAVVDGGVGPRLEVPSDDSEAQASGNQSGTSQAASEAQPSGEGSSGSGSAAPGATLDSDSTQAMTAGGDVDAGRNSASDDETDEASTNTSSAPDSIDDTQSVDVDTTAEPPDAPAPELLSVEPPPDSADVALDANLVLEFSVQVRPGEGELTLADERSVVERLTVTDARVTFVSQRITVDWETSLAFNTRYTVSIDEGAIVADTGNAQPWVIDTAVTFTTVAPPPIELVGTSPLTLATDIDPNANLVLTFSDSIVRGEGHLELRQASGALVERFDMDSSNAIVSGPTVTLDPSEPLRNATEYYLTAARAAVVSELGAVFEGFSSSTVFRFTTAAAPPPPLVLSSTTPANNASDVALDAGLTLVFAEAVRAGIGAISIVDADTGTPFESAMATDPRVSVSSNTVKFTPNETLAPATTYYVTIDAGSFESFAGASFAGITTSASLRFSTRGVPLSCGGGELSSPNGGCYYLHTTAATFNGAISLCAARGDGWHLAEPRSAAEQSAIQSIISADTWIGASDREEEGMWRWVSDGTQFWTGDVSGEPFADAYTRWSNVEPEGGAQNCARVSWANDPDGWYWADSPCDYHYHTLCEGPKQ